MTQDSSIDQLASALRDRARRMSPGERLPSTRELVGRHRVSPVTVSRALAELAAEGVVVTRPGSGTYVAERRATPAAARDLSWQTAALGDATVDATSIEYLLQTPSPGAITLNGGYPHPSLLPARALAAAVARAARRPDATERPPLGGLGALRAWFARTVGVSATAEDVLVTDGGQSALSTTLRAIAPAGTAMLVESPTYIGAIAIARGARVRPVPVPIDREGVRPELLADAFAQTGARVFYCQPTFQNPTGAVLAAERRREVIAVARAAGAFVIEDDYARLLTHGRPTPPPLFADDEDGHVIHVASLTKPTSPNLRVGAIIARGPIAERLRGLHVVDSFFVSRMLQEAALELVSAPGWARHLHALSAALAARCDALCHELAARCPAVTILQRPAGGLNVWVELPSGVDDLDLASRARDAGVLVNPGRPFFAAEPPAAYLRLSYAATASTDELREGVGRLAVALGG
jgi:DNA-binding transcriptional MocR family regulator